jgi:uncharacterized membrane protein
MSGTVRFGRGIAVIALTAGYALLAHYTIAARTEALGTLVALAPVGLATLSMAWNSRHRRTMLTIFGLACAALLVSWHAVENHFNQIYWMEHAGSQLFLCLLFGRTLNSGKEPMCTRFARAVHGTLTPELERYTRHVTVAWAGFFGSMAATSSIIFFTAPLTTWSAFANFFTAPLIGSMFVAEYLVRRFTHPHMEHASILAAVKAFWNVPAA